ncbi:hypothetical protein GBAR_LOCUS8409 [Geodia barretti]|uniref:CARD domain-containing protein n=1 Tax=Geodia barretti TaxID=519541 RepID=A0AA35WG68_GEOBA|nr:hypothetical protein GBAR_LOCUS8409 [Geodia barretti]
MQSDECSSGPDKSRNCLLLSVEPENSRLRLSQLIRERLYNSYGSVVQYLNLSELKIRLVKTRLLSPLEAHNRITDAEKLIARVEEIGLLAYFNFYQCVTKETNHLGHRYVQAVLENKEYASNLEVEHSVTLKDKLLRNLQQLTSCDLQALLNHMYSKNLLTCTEWDKLQSQVHGATNDLLIHIAAVLDSKGPLAHSIFAECLHSVDSEAYKLVFEEGQPHDSLEELTLDMAVVRVSRQFPSKLKLHGCLKGSRYNTIMKMFQECHHKSQWVKLELEVEKLMRPGTPKEFQVVSLLESAVSWAFRRREKEAVDSVAQARELAAQLDGDNSTILSGRCEYILSRLYRYLQQYDKAHEHILKSTHFLHMVEEGEDTAFLHFCNACIQIETLTDHPTQKQLRSVNMSYEHAIDHARAQDSGLDLVALHSFIRLAQMYLGSTHYRPGSQREEWSISKASSCLKAVKQYSMSPRSQCHYLLMESDLKRCQWDIPQARLAAQTALELAHTYSFTTENAVAEKRIDSLQHVSFKCCALDPISRQSS